MGAIKVKIKEVKQNKDNPRKITKHNYSLLIKSIRELPTFRNMKPLYVDEDMVVLGGNQRLKAYKDEGFVNVMVDVVDKSMLTDVNKARALVDKKHKDEIGYEEMGKMTYQELKDRIVILDNTHFGTWDKDMLTERYQIPLISDWGVDITGFGKDVIERPEVEFSEFLDEQHNYVVLYFDNRIDWLQAQTHFDLKTVAAKRSNGKKWSEGIGRVINGAKYLKRIIKDV